MKIYTRPSLIPAGVKPCIMLWPFLGIVETDTTDPDYGRFAGYVEDAPKHIELTDTSEQSDVFMLPFDYNPELVSRVEVQEFISEAKRLSKSIVVFYNSDCLLTFDDLINWKKSVVWVEQSEMEHIADILCDFHSSLSENAFEEMQRNNRKMYEEWIRPEAFFRKLPLYFTSSSDRVQQMAWSE